MLIFDYKKRTEIFNSALKYINDNKNEEFNPCEIEALEDTLKIKYGEIIKNDEIFFNRKKKILEKN